MTLLVASSRVAPAGAVQQSCSRRSRRCISAAAQQPARCDRRLSSVGIASDARIIGARRAAVSARAARPSTFTVQSVATGASPQLEAYKKLQARRETTWSGAGAKPSCWRALSRRSHVYSERGSWNAVPPSTTLRVPHAPISSTVSSQHQNGSDVRGVALPGVPKQDVNLTPLRCATLQAVRCTALATTHPHIHFETGGSAHARLYTQGGVHLQGFCPVAPEAHGPARRHAPRGRGPRPSPFGAVHRRRRFRGPLQVRLLPFCPFPPYRASPPHTFPHPPAHPVLSRAPPRPHQHATQTTRR